MVALLLSAALIVRNEERFLVGCLDSLEGFVDEVVLVDTGSTDATPRIAADRGITVHTFPWADDFSAARNRALDLARGEWILYIDADERIRAGAEHARKRHSGPQIHRLAGAAITYARVDALLGAEAFPQSSLHPLPRNHP